MDSEVNFFLLHNLGFFTVRFFVTVTGCWEQAAAAKQLYCLVLLESRHWTVERFGCWDNAKLPKRPPSWPLESATCPRYLCLLSYHNRCEDSSSGKNPLSSPIFDFFLTYVHLSILGFTGLLWEKYLYFSKNRFSITKICYSSYDPFSSFQDIALVGELTIKDCAMHFGWIYGMTKKQVEAKYAFLEELLDLPPEDKYVCNLR